MRLEVYVCVLTLLIRVRRCVRWPGVWLCMAFALGTGERVLISTPSLNAAAAAAAAAAWIMNKTFL